MPATHRDTSPVWSSRSGDHYDVIIVGGGLAGLTAAIALSGGGKKVLLLEKKIYPFHKVCGEYVSNEVLPYLQSLGFDPFDFGASRISRLRISSPNGRSYNAPLDLGGFGLSRYVMDHQLSLLAQQRGAHVITGARVTDVQFRGNQFRVEAGSGNTFSAGMVIGSYGKRDLLDKKLNREFLQHHTGYLGVKYHIRTDYPPDEVGLDNFRNGYCGIARIEDDKYNLCYLYKRTSGILFKSIPELEETVLFKNPVIREIFRESRFLNPQPEVINEICFAPKRLVEGGILMAGDSAGLITPLCGNGMSMAISGAKILTDLILGMPEKGMDTLEGRQALEAAYVKAWRNRFNGRLTRGRAIQRLFGNPWVTDLFLRTVHSVPVLERSLIRSTHGSPI